MRPNDAIVVINTGSSSIKITLFGDQVRVGRRFSEGISTASTPISTHFAAHEVEGGLVAEDHWYGEDSTHHGAMQRLLDFLGHHQIEAVGHRIVHGGTDYAAPVRLDADAVTPP